MTQYIYIQSLFHGTLYDKNEKKTMCGIVKFFTRDFILYITVFMFELKGILSFRSNIYQ